MARYTAFSAEASSGNCTLVLTYFLMPRFKFFGRVGGVNDFTDLQGKVKVSGQMLPVTLPAPDGMAVLAFPLLE
jgi:hypothetical protein